MNAYFLSRLGLLRWIAALVAVAFHVRALLFAEYAQLPHKGPLLALFYFVTSLGHEAFVVYMVASGLLLGMSWRRWQARPGAAWDDLRRKLVALYVLLVPVLAVGGMLDLAGRTFLNGSGVYSDLAKFAPGNLGPGTLAGNLLWLQDIVVPGFGSNAMLFLLAYEWWAYLVLTVFCESGRGDPWRGVLAAAPIAVAVILLAPPFLGFFGAWLAGVAVARHGARLAGKIPGWLGLAIALAGLLASRIGGSRLPGLPHGEVVVARIALDLLVALALAVMLLAQYGRRRRHAASWERRQRFLVKLSLPLYAAHFPVVVFVVAGASVLPDVPLHAQPSPAGFVLFAAAVGVACLFAYLLWLAAGLVKALLCRRLAMPAPDAGVIAARPGRPGAAGPARTSAPVRRAPPG